MRALPLCMLCRRRNLLPSICSAVARVLTAIMAALLFRVAAYSGPSTAPLRAASPRTHAYASAAIWIFAIPLAGPAGSLRLRRLSGGSGDGSPFHFALVGFPVILLIFFLRDREKLSSLEVPDTTLCTQ